MYMDKEGKIRFLEQHVVFQKIISIIWQGLLRM